MDITHHLTIKATPQRIYEAVATQGGINGWWSKSCQVGEQIGQPSSLKFDKEGTIVEMGFHTRELAPHSRVVWESTDNGNPAWLGTKIITEIEGSGNESTVVFSHAGFDQKWEGQDAFEMTKAGWEHFRKKLGFVLRNRRRSTLVENIITPGNYFGSDFLHSMSFFLRIAITDSGGFNDSAFLR